MRRDGIYHPLFATHPRVGLNTSMTDRVEIFKPTGTVVEPWSLETGIPTGAYELVYRGPARVQPNIDWRARDRNYAGELTATMACRVQLPIGGNELGEDVMISKDYQVQVIATGADAAPWLHEYAFVVRNAMQASQKWLYTFMADAGTRIVDDGE